MVKGRVGVDQGSRRREGPGLWLCRGWVDAGVVADLDEPDGQLPQAEHGAAACTHQAAGQVVVSGRQGVEECGLEGIRLLL